jgi:hypothetical protein
VLEALDRQVRRTALTLDSPREEWAAAVAGWLADGRAAEAP